MKANLLITLFLSLILFGCSQDSINNEIEELNLEGPQDLNTNFFEVTSPFVCDPDWVAPVFQGSQISRQVYHITYDASLTLEEVNCVRQEYFQEYCIVMGLIQPSDPYYDIWVRVCSGKTGNTNTDQTVEQTAQNDNKVCAAPPAICAQKG